MAKEDIKRQDLNESVRITSVASTYKRNITSFSPSKVFLCLSSSKRKPTDSVFELQLIPVVVLLLAYPASACLR
jgi:hypothetical protein